MIPHIQESSLIHYHLGKRDGSLLSAELRDQGFPLWDCHSRDEFRKALAHRQWRGIILQVDIPGPGILDRCRQIRADFSGPLVVILPASASDRQLDLFALGVDDVLTRELTPELMAARLRAMLRRTRPTGKARNKTGSPLFRSGELLVDPARREVLRDGQPVDLTDTEFQLLALLLEEVGRVVSREEISGRLRGLPHEHQDRSIDLRISRLRRKLGDDRKRPRLIRTVRGLGYMLMPPSLGR